VVTLARSLQFCVGMDHGYEGFNRLIFNPTVMLRSSFAVRVLVTAATFAALAACGSDSTSPSNGNNNSPDNLQFTTAQVKSLDSTGQVIVAANPGNADLKSLLDSTFAVFTAGIQAKRIDVSTNVTSAPLYFVGIHRAFSHGGSSSSTWTLIALDDPSHLGSLIEVSGFAQNSTSAAPSSVAAPIGNGIVNAMFLQVGAGGSVTQWHAGTGSVSFSSDAPGAACPGFTATAVVTCAIETMHVAFNASATGGSGGAGARQASVATTIDVPAMRLTYTF
jgi:hypothetical protein